MADKSFWDEISKILKDLLAAFLIFLLLIFVAGELYAVYFMRTGNDLMLWLPAILLMIVLAYKVID